VIGARAAGGGGDRVDASAISVEVSGRAIAHVLRAWAGRLTEKRTRHGHSRSPAAVPGRYNRGAAAGGCCGRWRRSSAASGFPRR
jgi:hypothetical protein